MWSEILTLIVAFFSIPVLIYLYLYLIAPLLLLRKNPIRIDRPLEPTDAESLTPEMRDFLGQAIAGLSAQGFAVEANVQSNELIEGFQSFQVLLVNRGAGDVVTLMAWKNNAVRLLSTLISTEFAGGPVIQTSNSRAPAVFPKNPSRVGMTFPWALDAAALYEMHRRRVVQRPPWRTDRARAGRRGRVPGPTVDR